VRRKKKAKVLTGARAKVMINGKEIGVFSSVTISRPIEDSLLREMREAFHKSIDQTIQFRTPIIIEPLDVILKCVTFQSDDLRNWSELANHQDTSSDELVKWMDERARMSPEDLELEAFWELAAE
jgi:hypothetical protein